MRRSILFAALAAVAACGGETGTEVADAAQARGVTVRTLDLAGRPLAGVSVEGRDPQGALLATTTTGLDGVASVEVPAGGSVTTHDTIAAGPSGISDRWYTVLSVAPGDDLVIPIDRLIAPAPTVRVTLPDPPHSPRPPDIPPQIQLHAACHQGSGRGASATLLLDSRCALSGPLVAAASDGEPYAYLVAQDIDLSAPTVTASGNWSMTGGTLRATIGDTGFQTDLQVDILLDGYPATTHNTVLRPSGGSASGSLPTSTVGDRALVRISDVAVDETCARRVRVARRSQGDLSTFVFSARDFLGEARGKTLAADNLSWSGGFGTSFVRVRLSGPHNGSNQTWTVLAPPGTTRVSLPADAGFEAADTVEIDETTTTRWSSYDDVRRAYLADPQSTAPEPTPFTGDFLERTTIVTWTGC